MHNLEDFKIIHGKSIREDQVVEALNLDYLCYPDEYHLSEETCIAYFRKNPDIYFLALNKDERVIGYINFSPVTEEQYEDLRSGKYIDTCITADDVLAFEPNKEYSVYFSSICVHPDYRKIGLAEKLLDTLFQEIENMKKQNIRIRRIVADAISEDGYRHLSNMGFKRISSSEHESIIMEKKFNA